jgi:hypothetical protein
VLGCTGMAGLAADLSTSASTRRRASLPGSSTASTGISAGRTRAQRAASPWRTRFRWMAGTARPTVVTTEKDPAIRLATGKAAPPMPTTGARAAAPIVSVMGTVVFGLTTRISMIGVSRRLAEAGGGGSG